MKKIIILLILCLLWLTQANAYLLTSSEIIGSRHFVFQLGYAGSNYGDQATLNRTGTEIKVGFGLWYPWDVLIYGVPGRYTDVAGQTFQTLGANLRFGIIKAFLGEKTPVDVSISAGVESTKTMNNNVQSGDESEWHFAVVIGKSYRRPSAYATPYLGMQYSSSNSGTKDTEMVMGFKYGLTSALSLMLEGSYHWVASNTATFNSAGWGMGVAWNI